MAKKKEQIVDELDVGEFLSSKFNSKTIKLNSANYIDTSIPYILPFKHLGLQKATGGIMGGKISSFEADSQTGKSMLLYEIFGSAINMGGACFLADAEQAYEADYGLKAGIPANTKSLLLSTSISMENNFSAAKEYMEWFRTKVKDLSKPLVIGIDSFVALKCKEQMEADAKNKEAGYGYMRKNMTFYDKLTEFQPLLAKYGATIIILNQLRINKQVMFADPTYSPGEMMKYFCTQRLKGTLSKVITKEVNDEKVKIGSTVRWETVKNRRVEPFKLVKVQFLYKSGLLKYSGLPDLLLREEEISKHIIKDPDDARKKIKGFYVSGDDKKTFYPLEKIKDAINDFPHLLEPKWTQFHEDDSEEFNEEDATDDELDLD
jgi:RecA/RadA recombinase